MTTPSEQEGHPSSFPLFDWLRFAMASVVALVHQHVIPWEPAANLAVQVFFALSGWLIGGILLRTERPGLLRFFFNRGTRIWIPYAAAVAALYAVSLLKDPISSNWLRNLFADVTFTHNWFINPEADWMPLEGTSNHFWSIAVEEQFYLAAPLIMLGLAWGKRAFTWVLIAAASVMFTPHFGAISLGVLAAVLQRDFGNWHLRGKSRAALLGLLALAGLFIAAVPGSYRYSAPVFAVCAVLLLAVEGRRSSTAMFFGGMSYPLYLNHWIGTFAANAFAKRAMDMPPVAAGLLGYVLALVVGSIAYILVDRNVQRLRGGFYTAERGRTFAVAAYTLLIVGLIGGFLWPR